MTSANRRARSVAITRMNASSSVPKSASGRPAPPSAARVRPRAASVLLLAAVSDATQSDHAGSVAIRTMGPWPRLSLVGLRRVRSARCGSSSTRVSPRQRPQRVGRHYLIRARAKRRSRPPRGRPPAVNLPSLLAPIAGRQGLAGRQPALDGLGAPHRAVAERGDRRGERRITPLHQAQERWIDAQLPGDLIGRSCIEARLRRPGTGAALDRLETLPIRYEWLGIATAHVDEEGLAAIPDDPGPVRPALDLIEHERGVHMFRVDPHDG